MFKRLINEFFTRHGGKCIENKLISDALRT
jgi:hypothetical protein